MLAITNARAQDSDPGKDSSPGIWSPERQTLTGDWFGQGSAMRDAGVDLRLEWSQFYQGLVSGDGDKSWDYGGKFDALLRLDFSQWGLWEGFSGTVQGYGNVGNSVKWIGRGNLASE